MMLPHLTPKTLRAYLLDKEIAFSIPISQLPVVLLSGNTAEVPVFVMLLLYESKPKMDLAARKCPTPKHWSIE